MHFLSQNILKLRLSRKLTQEELANKLCVTEQTVSSWETGDSKPDADLLVQIADTFGTDVATLLDSNPENRKKDGAHLLIAVGILLILGGFLYFLAPIAARMKLQFEMAPMIVEHIYLLPALWLVLGWAVMQGLGMLGVVRPARSKFSRPIHVVVLILVLLYAALMLPYLIEAIKSMLQLLQYQQNPSLYPDGFQYSYNMPAFLQNVEWVLLNALYNQPSIFAIPGMIFWLSKPKRRKGFIQK